jgi:hypothetical protein
MAQVCATVNGTSMELTPMQVLFTPPGASTAVDLGGTLSGVGISIKYSKAELHADQAGKTVLDRRTTGLAITVTTELAEVQNKDLWKILFPHATEISTSTKAIDFVNSVGDSDLLRAGKLTLHPLSKALADVTTDYNFPKACSSAESEITYSPDGQSKLKIVWNILPDTSVCPAIFGRYGDTSL